MICAIIPVKALALAKGRLAGILTSAERQALVLAMLGDVLAVVRAAHNIGRVGVVSRDRQVLALAAAAGAEGLPDRARDLNGALASAAGYYAAAGATAVLIVPADVPLMTPGEIERLIAMLGDDRGLVLVPSRDGGTNALLVRPPGALPFQFGAGSLARHLEAARARGIAARVSPSAGLERDVDRPDDLLALADTAGATASQRLVRKLNICARLACV